MDGEIGSQHNYPTGDQWSPYGTLPHDRPAGAAASRLTKRASLIVVPLLSIWLWGGIWMAVTSLARILLR